MNAKYWGLGIVAGLLALDTPALADQGLANFSNIDRPAKEAAAPSPTRLSGGKKQAAPKPSMRAVDLPVVDPWGPVPSEKISIVNLAPGLLPFFNNAPVFGLPGTVTGGFWDRTQLTGDWGGARTDLARKGVFFDLYTTSTYQDVTSGGLKTGSSFVQNSQLSVNIDTGRAGLWDGGLFHYSMQSRYGDLPADTFTAGTGAPQFTGLVQPGPLLANDTLPSEYFLAQALGKHVDVVVGKISDIFIPDQTLFGDSYKYYFANFNFNKNPMTINFYNPTAWAALGVVTPTTWLALAGGVLDPNSQSDNFATDAFNGVNLYMMAILSYKLDGLPGQFSPAFNWSNQPQLNLEAPYSSVSRSQIPQALGGLLGTASTDGLSANYSDESWFALANFSQYLYVKDDAATIAKKLKSGQVINGVGLFGRVGYAPDDTNTITRDGSIALVGHGLFDARPYDSFGAGFYYNQISGDFKNSVRRLTAGTVNVQDESGVEVFYDFAITPAVRLIPSYQHIWNPLDAQIADNEDHADVVMARLNIAW